jgi:hypothetical protein
MSKDKAAACSIINIGMVIFTRPDGKAHDEAKLCRITAQRHMAVGGGFLLREWSGQFSNYRRIDGMLIPTSANTMWRLESGDWEYFRGEVTQIEYDV